MDIVGGAPLEMDKGFERLCCFGRVGGGRPEAWPAWRLNCFFRGAGGGGGGGGGGVGPYVAAGGGAGGNGKTGDIGLAAV